jgi:AcrR family transcriptional regulator
MMMADSRQHILDTAASLFYRDGYRAVGVDTIVAQSGVAKMTLYRHFPSKDDLIVAYLDASNERFWVWFEDVTKEIDDPRAKLIAFFRAQETLVNAPLCYGCPFLNAVVDFPDVDHPGHAVAVKHKQAVRARLHTLAQQAGARDPQVLADQLFLLMDGAFMSARMFGGDNPALHVGEAAQILIEAQIPR